MLRATEILIPAKSVRSLVWEQDDLVDWAGGGQRYRLNGETVPRHVSYAYVFDAAITSPSGEYTVIYTRLGTKGLLLRRGQVLREINRSFYHANAYEYPVTMFCLKNGREVLAHCPDEYCRLEIDDLATGERLTSSETRRPQDFFHSRLGASPGGTYLVSAGWIWHPVDAVHVYDVEAALRNPAHLDGAGLDIDAWAEESSAAFLTETRLAVALEGIENEDEVGADDMQRREVRIFDLKERTSRVVIPATRVGTIMSIGEHHLLGLCQHPQLIDLRTGLVAQEWPEVRSGTQTSSILVASPELPPIALDPIRRRCAIADREQIIVLQFDE